MHPQVPPLLLLIASAGCALAGDPITNLRYVAVITRHGSRSPLSTYPNDPYPYTDKEFWPDGPAQITNLGKNQLYHTGVRLRNSYQGYLSQSYYPGETMAKHNDNDRDFNSVAVLLAGLYPPVGNQIWNQKLLWQPIVSKIRDFDICNLDGGSECPVYASESKRVVETLNQNVTQYKDFLEYVSTTTGQTYKKLSELWELYDTLLMQFENGLALPKWAYTLFKNDVLEYFSNKAVLLAYSGSEKLLRLGAGPELKFISDLMTAKANGLDGDNQKLYVEAAHDCTLIALLYALGYSNPKLRVDTGAFLIVELHEINTDHIVKVFYFRNPFDNSPLNIRVTNCGSPCTLEKFNNLVDSINPKDWKKECSQ